MTKGASPSHDHEGEAGPSREAVAKGPGDPRHRGAEAVMEIETAMLPERASGPASKVVGLYQMLLRRNLEHFFPDATLDLDGDRSFIHVDALAAGRTVPDRGRAGRDRRDDRVAEVALPVPARQPDAVPAGRAPPDRRDRPGPRPPVPRPVRPRGGPPGGDVPVRLRGLHRHRVPRPARGGPGPGGAGGPAGRGAVDLREPPGLHRRPAAGHRERPGPARLDQHRGSPPVTASA